MLPPHPHRIPRRGPNEEYDDQGNLRPYPGSEALCEEQMGAAEYMRNTQSRSSPARGQPQLHRSWVGVDSHPQQCVGPDGLVYHFGQLQEGLLVDCGAIGNCSGDVPIRIHDKKAAAYGLPPSVRTKRESAMNLAGVGQGVQTALDDSVVKGVLSSGDTIDYKAATLPNSDVPMLLGLTSMAEKNAFIGTRSGKLHLVPTGKDSEIVWPEGTRTLQCVKAASGHWVLPIDNFGQQKSQ